ncbi:MAG: hypothetical protein JWP37_692 [Mucilaginibacter sp.]|nr:hypothetical protein [Mucilaginibacter sp.]
MSKPEEDNPPTLFNHYLSSQNDEFRQCLTDLYLLIRSIVPDAEETFSYQVHCFKHIYMLVGIGANKKYCSLYTMSSSLVKSMKDELTGCKILGSTIHFKPGEPLPAALIARIVIARKQENELLAMACKKK